MNSLPVNVCVTLRYGNSCKILSIERTNDPEALDRLKDTARNLCDRNDISNQQIILFRHDNLSPQLLQPLNNLFELTNGSIIEVILIDEKKPTNPHTLVITSYKTPTFCDYCGEFLVGILKQGLQCNLCRQNFHKRCSLASRNDCSALSSSNQSSNQSINSIPHSLILYNFKTLTVCRVCDKMLFGIFKQGFRCRECQVAVHRKCSSLLEDNCHLSENAIEPTLERMSLSEPEEKIENEEDNMIPLSRLPGQVVGMRQRTNMEGWLIHFEYDQPDRRLRHYWLLANDCISLYNEHNGDIIGVNPCRVYRTIPLSQVLAITPYNGESIDEKYPAHAFEIRTINNVVYCVGEQYQCNNDLPPSKVARQFSRRSGSNSLKWLQALTLALQPPSNRNDSSNAEPALQLSQLYQVLAEQTLGSGQFGTVYGGIHRQSGREVAIKVISKQRFSKKSSGAESLRSEVGILQSISHPGIVRLESMFETQDKIFVVMEKLNGDMLEMILSQEAGKLSERTTMFLLWQILSALKYLHNKDIAHCDLKPENVLLSQQSSPFPQTKLCDFGYARFIGEQQFRKTIVGTPAYLPPEVLQKKGYNKSLDMWSVGVIIYVTLSGTFPFNDGEEVQEQIENAAFMFPKEIWNGISHDVIDLIQRLLQVQIEQRLSIEECMSHEWLQSNQLIHDLKDLESRVGYVYLT